MQKSFLKRAFVPSMAIPALAAMLMIVSVSAVQGAQGSKRPRPAVRPLPGSGSDPAAIQAPAAGGSFAAPTDLRVTSILPEGILLEWRDNSTQEDGFYVDLKEEGGTFVDQGVSAARDQPRYLASKVKPNTRYTFRVRAWRTTRREPFTETETSGYSNEISATTVPAPPYKVTAVLDSATQVELTWECDCAAVTALVLESRHGQGGFQRGPSVDPHGAARRLLQPLPAALTPGTGHTYRFIASNGIGSSKPSDEARVFIGMPAVDAIPPAPTLSASRASATQANLEWFVAVNFNNIHSMVLERRDEESATFAAVARLSVLNRDPYSGVVTLSSDSVPTAGDLASAHPRNGVIRFADRTLRQGRRYVYRVKSVNPLGDGPYSAERGIP